MGWMRVAAVIAGMGSGLLLPTVGHAEDDDEKKEGEDKPALVGGYDEKNGFHIQSEDGNYLLGIGLQAGYKIEPVFLDGKAESRTAFSFLRPIMRGNIFRPWIRFWTSLELADPPIYLLDSYVELQPVDAVGVRAGQQYTPLSRHESWGPQQILFPEFAAIANYYWTGRDKGVTLFGTMEHLEYYAGIYGGSPLRTNRSEAGKYQLNARATFFPMGKPGYGELPYIMSGDEEPPPLNVSFTLQGAGGEVDQVAENFNPESGVFQILREGEHKFVTGGVDLFIQARRFSFFGEAYLSRNNPMNGAPNFTSIGAWFQADYVFYRKVLDFAVRLSFLDPSFELSDDLLYIVEGQVAWFVKAPHLAFKLRYQLAHQQPANGAKEAGVVIPTDVGTSQLITLQLNLAF
ncbi:OprO/OprP family phosphate-selective porin [Myxococcus sp. K15C18031901]|uniref:porin n=1 Tax=Myxococcus dinghuensis TaxID=2906761 RepID=UPI0020A7B11C|nr:porin [Myxococcus dinghuensis]MCP3104306.1 OprO/OprP family phosphate-selective porin [Myxococcus dinghuensis]